MSFDDCDGHPLVLAITEQCYSQIAQLISDLCSPGVCTTNFVKIQPTAEIHFAFSPTLCKLEVPLPRSL